MDGFHVEGMAEDKFDPLLAAEIGEPVPGEHAFHADDQAVTERRYRPEKGFRRAGNIAVQEHVALRIQEERERPMSETSLNGSFVGNRFAENGQQVEDLNFRILVETIPHLVWSARADGISDYYNARFLEYLGRSMEEMAVCLIQRQEGRRSSRSVPKAASCQHQWW